MAEYIDRETLRRQLLLLAERHAALGNVRVAQDYNWAITVLDGAPSEDVAPVIHGRFVHIGLRFAGGVDWWNCSICGSLVSGVETRFIYCPNCGAKMDGGDPDGR